MGCLLYPRAWFNAEVPCRKDKHIWSNAFWWWFRLSKESLVSYHWLHLKGQGSKVCSKCSMQSSILLFKHFIPISVVKLYQLSCHRPYPKQVKSKFTAGQLSSRKYWRWIYFKIMSLTLFSGYTLLFYCKILLDSCYYILDTF